MSPRNPGNETHRVRPEFLVSTLPWKSTVDAYTAVDAQLNGVCARRAGASHESNAYAGLIRGLDAGTCAYSPSQPYRPQSRANCVAATTAAACLRPTRAVSAEQLND